MKLALFLLALPLMAQTAIKCPVSNWVGLGAGYNPSASPKATGWISEATCISQSQGIYSYSTYEAIPQRNAVPLVSARTGVATVLRQFGPSVYLLALATAGMAQTGTATTGAFSGGGMLMYRHPSGFTFEAGARILSAGGNQQAVYEVGVGHSW